MNVSLEYTGTTVGSTSDVRIWYIAKDGGVPRGRQIPLTTDPPESALPEGELLPGERVTGDIYFQIEPGSDGTFRILTAEMTDEITVLP